MMYQTKKTITKLKQVIYLLLLVISTVGITMSFSKIKVEESTEVFETGNASYYGFKFLGRKTANGEIFTEKEYTCAHKSLPFGTKIKVTNTNNGKSIIVRVNDRGPFAKGRIIDLSIQGAKDLGLIQSGIAPVELEIVNQEYSSVGNLNKKEQVLIDNSYAYIDLKNKKIVDKIYKSLDVDKLEVKTDDFVSDSVNIIKN